MRKFSKSPFAISAVLVSSFVMTAALAPAQAQSEAAVSTVTEQVQPVVEAVTEAVTESVTESVTEPVAEPVEDRIIASGTWTKKSFRSKGTWTIAIEDGVTMVKLDADFSTRKAPDLKIFLSPKSVSEVNKRNALEGSVLIAPLSSNKGAQSYVVPEGVDLSGYQSIIIHCEAFTKLWSAAAL